MHLHPKMLLEIFLFDSLSLGNFFPGLMSGLDRVFARGFEIMLISAEDYLFQFASSLEEQK